MKKSELSQLVEQMRLENGSTKSIREAPHNNKKARPGSARAGNMSGRGYIKQLLDLAEKGRTL